MRSFIPTRSPTVPQVPGYNESHTYIYIQLCMESNAEPLFLLLSRLQSSHGQPLISHAILPLLKRSTLNPKRTEEGCPSAFVVPSLELAPP